MAPHIVNFLLGSFGIVAAVLLIGGSIGLRWQKNRYRYELMRKALESGTPLPKAPPTWISSRRDGMLIAALGLGLMIVGCGAWGLGAAISQPADAAAIAASEPAPPDVGPMMGMMREARGRRLPIRRWSAGMAQERVAIGQTALGSGFILALLGMVRLGSARTERRFGETQETI